MMGMIRARWCSWQSLAMRMGVRHQYENLNVYECFLFNNGGLMQFHGLLPSCIAHIPTFGAVNAAIQENIYTL